MLRHQCDRLNSECGACGDGYDCFKCLNRGGSYRVEDGAIAFRKCECAEIRRSIRNIRKSGVGELLTDYTFDKFATSEPWQEKMKSKAMAFLDDCKGNWFYAGGQIGSGKTMICTAILGELLKRGMACRYMRWKDESTKLKAVINENAYYESIEAWKSCKVLYIDDFFKMPPNKKPTDGDLNIAFELINARYASKSLITIISSEHDLDTLMDYDEAVGSRIYERCRKYHVLVERDEGKNQREKAVEGYDG